MYPSTKSSKFSFICVFFVTILLSSCGGGGSGSNGATSGNGTNGGGTSGGSSDTTAPIITLIGNATEDIDQGSSYSDAGATANDNVDGDISANINISGDTVDTSTAGIYTIIYNVSDAAGNAATQATRTITVISTPSNQITTFIAYKVSDLDNKTQQIYTVRGNGADHRELHPNIPSDGEISEYSWAPTAKGRIAYLGDVDTDTVDELYSVDPNSNSRVKLNGTLPSGGDVVEYQWSPDGTKVAYRANQDEFGKIELYVVDSDGQNRAKLNSSLTGGGNVEEFSWSPASSHILYKADANVNDQFDWFVASANGTSSNQVNVNLATGDSVLNPRWAPLGNYIDYIHDFAGNAEVDLYIYKLSDLSNTKMDTFTFANAQDYDWSDSEQHFIVAQQFGGLLIHSIDGRAMVNISDIGVFEFIPNTENFIATKTEVISQFNHNQVVGVYAPDGTIVNSEIEYVIGASGSAGNFSFSPDGLKAVFEFNGNGYPDEIYVYDISTNSSVNLDAVINSKPNLSDIQWSQDSSRILAYRDLSFKSTLSPDGSGLVNLGDSTSSSVGLLYNGQWAGNEIFLTRNTGQGPTSGDIIKVDKNGQNPVILANSDTTHAFFCANAFCIGTPSFELSNDLSFMTYKRVGDPDSAASDDLHTINVDGTGDTKISVDLDPPLTLRISEYSIQNIF